MEPEENELDTELETELDSADETEIDEVTADETDPSDAESAPGGVEGGDKPKPTVEDAIAEALKSLEPKTDEQKAADKAASDAAAKKVADEKAGVKPTDEPKLDKDGKPVDPKKVTTDHVNDPIPPQVSERTRERITSLVGTVKEQTAIIENQGAIVSAIQETGATPEEFSAMITYMRYVHSEKPADLESAYAMLQGGLRTIANKLGRSLPEVNVLDGHADLLEAVTSGQTTKKIAEEVAIARNRAAATDTSRQAMQTAAQTEAAAKAEKDTAITELNDIGANLAKTDPNYKAKYAAIVPALQATFAHVRPSLWKKAFHDAYNACKVTATVATLPVIPKKVPLRPAAPAGGGKREPKSLEDAIFGEGFPG